MAKKKGKYICNFCGEEFKPFNLLQKVCNYACAIGFNGTPKGLTIIEREAKKAEAIKLKVERNESKEKKDSIKNWKKELQIIINKIVRLIDDDLPCISSGRITGQSHAGHYHSCGSNPSLRYNFHNIHKQSSADNNYKSGNLPGYRLGLIKRYGKNYFEMVESLPLTYPKIQLKDAEMKELVAECKVIIKDLPSLKERFNTTELRNFINHQLGIYK